MDFYEEYFKQCNEHLRETDKKRDQIIAFYAILLAAFFNSFDKIDRMNNLKSAIAIFLFIIGLCLSVVLLLYRNWHIRYNHGAILLQYLWSNNKLPTKKNVEEAWYHIKIDPHIKVNPLKHTEAAIFNAFLFISLIPLYVIISSGLSCILILIIFFIYIIIWNLISFKFLQRVKEDKPSCLWLLKFYDLSA